MPELRRMLADAPDLVSCAQRCCDHLVAHGYELPSLVYLAGKGYAAEITFAFTPWLASGSAATPAFTAVRAAIEDAEEAARRAADDDD